MLTVLMLPPTTLLVALAMPLLSIWLNPAFALQAAPLLQVFALGIFLNSLAHLPFTYLQARGASRLSAAIHLAEAPFYLLLLCFAISHWGTMGAAMAWLLRIVADMLLMFGGCLRVLGWRWREAWPAGVALQGLAALVAFAAAWTLSRWPGLMMITAACLLALWPCRRMVPPLDAPST